VKRYGYKVRLVVEATFEVENNAQAFGVQNEIARHLAAPSQWPPSHSGVELHVEVPPQERRLYAI
jgi:hypothetical protein